MVLTEIIFKMYSIREMCEIQVWNDYIILSRDWMKWDFFLRKREEKERERKRREISLHSLLKVLSLSGHSWLYHMIFIWIFGFFFIQLEMLLKHMIHHLQVFRYPHFFHPHHCIYTCIYIQFICLCQSL
jgi:hypothetical protein